MSFLLSVGSGNMIWHLGCIFLLYWRPETDRALMIYNLGGAKLNTDAGRDAVCCTDSYVLQKNLDS